MKDAKMSENAAPTATCQICGKEKPITELLPAELVRDSVRNDMRAEHPEWSDTGYVCTEDLKKYRMRHVRERLEKAHGKLTKSDEKFLESLESQTLISRDVDTDVEGHYTFGQRLADSIADFGGSWRFIIIFMSILVGWITLNAVALMRKPFDPYPFILLNLVLSCLAALQAPVIMMSQNRQESKDRRRAKHDYYVNLKAELEIQHLHEKIDHYLFHEWRHLLEIQRTQIKMMKELLKESGTEEAVPETKKE
jgi:uncharacterized membrane protein